MLFFAFPTVYIGHLSRTYEKGRLRRAPSFRLSKSAFLWREAPRQEDDGRRVREWWACLLGWFWSLGLASTLSLSLSVYFFSSSLPVGPTCPLTVSPQLAKKDPTAHWGSACPFWTNSSILVNMYILPFEFSISEPSVILTLAFSELLRWALHVALGHAPSLGGHIHRHSRETVTSFQVPGWL